MTQPQQENIIELQPKESLAWVCSFLVPTADLWLVQIHFLNLDIPVWELRNEQMGNMPHSSSYTNNTNTLQKIQVYVQSHVDSTAPGYNPVLVRKTVVTHENPFDPDIPTSVTQGITIEYHFSNDSSTFLDECTIKLRLYGLTS
ncbi:hypothetical protein [Flavitalea sp.]|nr:hypothetical protein [Flavitalea sp.]